MFSLTRFYVRCQHYLHKSNFESDFFSDSPLHKQKTSLSTENAVNKDFMWMCLFLIY